MDINLKYVIIQSLVDLKLFSFNRDRFIEENNINHGEVGDYSPTPEVETFLANITLDHMHLKKVTELWTDTFAGIYRYIWCEMEPETDYFHIESLEGIELCPNIKKIDINMLSYISDFSPLTKLEKLEEVTVEYGWPLSKKVLSLKPFLNIKSLKSLTLRGLEHSFFGDEAESIQEIVKELEANKIKVELEFID